MCLLLMCSSPARTKYPNQEKEIREGSSNEAAKDKQLTPQRNQSFKGGIYILIFTVHPGSLYVLCVCGGGWG